MKLIPRAAMPPRRLQINKELQAETRRQKPLTELQRAILQGMQM
jgi:hypothetical protein